MADDEEFWLEDVQTQRHAELEKTTGLRMPAASAPVDLSFAISPKQLAFALCLGIEIRSTDTPEIFSKRIDHTKSRADGYRINDMQVALGELLHLDLDDCDTRSDAAWALWDEYKEDPAHFLQLIDGTFQRRFCGGSLSRFGIGHSSAPQKFSRDPLTMCSSCQRPVSAWAVLCPECGGVVRSSGVKVPLKVWVVSLAVFVIVTWLIG